MAARIAALLDGDASERAVAYAQLTALSHRQPCEEVDAHLAEASVVVAGLELNDGEEVEALGGGGGELAALFGRFGRVLTVTHEPGAKEALVTFAEPAEAQAALDGVERLRPPPRSLNARRPDARNLLRTHQDRARAGTAAACIVSLVETWPGLSDAEEFQRCALLQLEIWQLAVDSGLDPVQEVGVEWFRRGSPLHVSRSNAVYSAPDNAYAVSFTKDAKCLTRADALTIACAMAPAALTWCRGIRPTFLHAGTNFLEWMNEYLISVKIGPGAGGQDTTDAMRERLCLLWLEIHRDPRGISTFGLASVWMSVSIIVAGRPTVALTMIKAGIINVLVSSIRLASPVDWVTWTTPSGMLFGCMFHLAWALSTTQLPSVNKEALFIDTGFVDVAISALKAYEVCGPSKVEGANILSVWCSVELLAQLDLTTPEAQPIVEMLKAIPSTLRFVLEHELVHVDSLGYTTSSVTARVCALAFGKDEGGKGALFEFSQADIELIVTNRLALLSGAAVAWNPELPAFFMRPVVHLCISDANKELLVQCATELMPLLVEALLLDPEHTRQSQPEHVKAAIQEDASECLLQLALFAQGREMLLEQELQAGAMAALRSLADSSSSAALTERVRLCACSALMAIEGGRAPREPREPASLEMEGATEQDKHVMMSYQWSTQRVIERIVRSLQARGYRLWYTPLLTMFMECMVTSAILL